MTLQLSLKQLRDLPTDTAIIVEGSEAGLLCSRKGTDNIIDLTITCSRFNLLTFKVFEGEQFKTLEGGEGYIGESFFSGQRFLRENKYNKKLYQKGNSLTRNFDPMQMRSTSTGHLTSWWASWCSTSPTSRASSTRARRWALLMPSPRPSQ